MRRVPIHIGGSPLDWRRPLVSLSILYMLDSPEKKEKRGLSPFSVFLSE